MENPRPTSSLRFGHSTKINKPKLNTMSSEIAFRAPAKIYTIIQTLMNTRCQIRLILVLCYLISHVKFL